jgi:hypothetical protein
MPISNEKLSFFFFSFPNSLRIQRAAQSDSGNYTCKLFKWYYSLNEHFCDFKLSTLDMKMSLSGEPTGYGKSASVFVNVISGEWQFTVLKFHKFYEFLSYDFILITIIISSSGKSTRHDYD